MESEANALTINEDIDASDAQRAWVAVRLHGLRQSDVAERLGVVRETVNRWLRTIDEDVAQHYANTPGLTLLACECERLRLQEARIERDVFRLREKYKIVDGEPKWSERTELAIIRNEKLLLDIRKSRFDMLTKTGLISTAENRGMLRVALEEKVESSAGGENELTKEQLLAKALETLARCQFISQ